MIAVGTRVRLKGTPFIGNIFRFLGKNFDPSKQKTNDVYEVKFDDGSVSRFYGDRLEKI